MNFDRIIETATTSLTAFGLKALGALAVWIVGRYLISMAVRLVSAALTKQHVDPTLLRYIGNIVSVALNIVLVVAILGYFGVETTSFAALVAAMGIAIGAAWAGLLANFAAGAFLIVLRPFKVGDAVSVGGVTGTVQELGLFGTTIVTPDNVLTVVGNGKIFADTIQNFSALPVRRVDRTAQLAGSVDPGDAIARLRAAMATIPNVATTPAPQISLLDMTVLGPVIAVRPYTHNDHYWQVYFDTNEAIVRVCREAGWPAPTPSQIVRQA